jgi:hypothetical protein
MSALSGRDVLDLWEQVDGLAPARRALVLAAAGGTGRVEPHDVAAMPVGARDARLLELRRQLAGPVLEAVVACPACTEDVEVGLDTAVLLALGDARPDGAGPDGAGGPSTTEVDGMTVTWRAPTAGDLDAVAALAATDGVDPEAELWRRCVLEVRPATDPDDLPAPVRSTVAAQMADADPLSEVLLDVVCGACGESFPAEIDVATFTWTEVVAAARRVLREVDVLARAYGWTEPEVLALSDGRRAAYLEMVLGDR